MNQHSLTREAGYQTLRTNKSTAEKSNPPKTTAFPINMSLDYI